MSNITILKDAVKPTGLKQTLSPENCVNCGSKKAVAEMNKIPMCRNCFAKTLGKTITQIQKPYGGLNHTLKSSDYRAHGIRL